MRFFQTKLQDSRLMNYSLSDMVREIVKNPTVFEGRKYIIINEIKKVNNNSSDGGKEISEAWDIAKKNGCKEAKRKAEKYFHKALKVVSIMKNECVKANLKSEPKSENSPDKLTEASPSGEKKVKSHPVLEKIERKLTQLSAEVKNKFDLNKLKETNENKESLEEKKTYYSDYDEFIDNLKNGESLSKNELSYIKMLMSYIRSKKTIDEKDKVRVELDNLFKSIINALNHDVDKQKTVLRVFKEQRFISIYGASCRVETCAVVYLLEKQGFPREIIKKIKDYIIDYSYKYLCKLKLNEPEYDQFIKNIKKYSDFEVFKGVESIEKIHLIKDILSENEFTSENRKFLTELSHDVKDGRIIEFIKEKMNSDIELLQSEYNAKRDEEKIVYDKYIKERNEVIETGINRVKSMLVMKSISKNIVGAVFEIINKKRSSTEVDVFSSKIDLIIDILQCKRVKANKITNDIEHYLNISIDELRAEVEMAKSKKPSFKERFYSLFNDLNNWVLNFIYNVKHAFK